MKFIAAFLIALFIAGAAMAVNPSEMLKDPVLETRAREVSKVLRCVVCQNETIDESDADLARDMRLLVRTRILAGDSNDAVIAYMVGRYGDYVLLQPRFTARTTALWLGPLIILLLGAWVVTRRLRARTQQVAALTPEEKASLEALTKSDEKPS